MRYSFVSAVLALTSSAVAQTLFDAIQTPAENQILVAGTSFDLVWNPAGVTGKATIQLNEGLTNVTLQPGPIIAQSIDNILGKFTWTPEDRGHPTYGWQITLDDDSSKQQLSHFFHIAAKGSSSSTSGASTSTSTSTVKLGTGPSYTSTVSSTSTAVIPSSTLTVVTTSTSAFPTTTPSGNQTTTSVVLTTNAAPTSTSAKGSSTSTSSAAAITSSSAAVANAVRGGLAVVGGLAIALAL